MTTESQFLFNAAAERYWSEPEFSQKLARAALRVKQMEEMLDDRWNESCDAARAIHDATNVVDLTHWRTAR